jgi:enterochelin esterase-like enzyme
LSIPRCRLVVAIAIVAACVTPSATPAQQSRGSSAVPGARTAALDRRKLAALQAAIAEVEAGRRSTPLIAEAAGGRSATVTFLATRGGGPVPRIVSDVTGWGEQPDDTFDFNAGRMARVGTTDWYFLETTVAPRARIEYLVAHGLTDYRRDPNNPREAQHRGGGPASEFVMPGYVPPEEFEDSPAMPAGRVAEDAIDSRAFGERRQLFVYTPPGYREGGNYPVAVFHGLNAHATGAGPRLLDWLIARRAIDPLVAVFADSWPRDTDEAGTALARRFLTGELLDWVASRYSITTSPGERAILGISFGAKDVLDAATCANVYDRVGLLIPGRRLKPADITAFVGQRERRLQVAILAGRYDAPNLPTARRVQQVLTAAGHSVDYIEVPEGHNPSTWCNHLRAVLVSLFGTTPHDGVPPASGR